MRTLFAHALTLATLASGSIGCGHSHGGGHTSGSSFPSHSSGSSSSSASSSHASGSGSSRGGGSSSSSHAYNTNTSYYGTHPSGHATASRAPSSGGSRSSGSVGSAGSGSKGKSSDSGDGDTTSEILQAVAAGLINAVGSATDGSVEAEKVTRTHPETPCEAQLREFRDMHPEGGAKLPPQLRCGPNGEWGGEPVSQNR